MKKIVLMLAFALIGKLSQSQGLENIIVEKYYVSNAADAAGSAGTLPTGSVTYRFFADLAPGYKLQAVYGASGHNLVFTSSTTFFNNTDRGALTPNWTKAQAADNTVMLDSYLTVGATTNNNNVPTSQVGILKTEDDAVGTVVNGDGILLNNDPSAGTAIAVRDGFTNGTLQDVQVAASAATILAMEAVFGDVSQASGSFILSDGSIAAIPSSGIAGMSGPTATNRVFIGQVTTTGTVHYELNVQITNSDGSIVQNYVALNPIAGELSIPSLKGDLGVTLAGEPSSNGTISFGTTTSNSMVVNFTGGNGAKRILLARAASAVNANPVDGFNYVANSAFTTGDQIGTGNYVMYVGTGLTTTVTGLNPNTTYHFRLLEFNDGGVSGAENYLTTTFASGNNTTASLGTTYNWNQTGAGPFNYNTAANWTPARTTPSNDDILIFGNGTTNTIISNVVSQTVARILVQNNTSIILQSLGANTLTVNGNTTSVDDFRVDAGSSLTLSGASPVSLYVGSAATANIYGSITLATGNTLTAGSTSGIIFRSGSSCTTASTFTGAPFGLFAATASSVLFGTGSTYTHNAGDNPFQKTAPASNVVFSAGSSQIWNTASGFDASGRTYGNLTVNSTVSASLSSSLTVQNLIQGATGQITLSGTSTSAINISGDVTNDSPNPMSLTSGSGSVNFTKVGTQNIGGVGAGAITILPTMNLVTGNTTNTTRSMALNNLSGAGTLKFNAAGLNASFTGTISGTPGITAFGAYNLNVSFTGTGAIGNLRVTNAINNLTIDRVGSSSILSSNVTVFGTVNLVNGDLNSNGRLTLGSISNRQGIVSGASVGNLTGNVNVQRYIAGSPYSQRFLSCPVSGLTTNTAWGDDFTVRGTFPFTYNPTITSGFVYPTIWTYDATNVAPFTAWESANSAAITPLTGYAATCGSATAKTLDVFGPVNNGPYAKTITTGFNLLGNPYPSPIRWSLLQALNPGTVAPYYYAYVGASGSYGAWNGVVGTLGVTDTIYTSQGIFVEGTSAGSFNIDNSVRFGSSAGTFFRTSSNPKNILKINLEDQNGNLDQIAIYSSENGSDTYNLQTDVLKLPYTPENLSQEFSLVLDNNKLAIKEFGSMGIERMIPLDVVVKTDGVYNFNVGEYSEIENNNAIYLVDALTNQKIKLTETSSYNVELTASVYSNRFFLNLAPESALGINENTNNGLDCYVNNNSLNMVNSGQAQNLNVQILDLNGKQVFTETVYSNVGITTINLPAVAQGVYVVRMVSNSSIVTKKILIK